MVCSKKIIGNLFECYALLLLDYNQSKHLVVASEKNDKCLLYDLEGNYEETIWEGPGGVMSMEQVPGTNGQFLTTQLFYSTNHSEKANISIVTPVSEANWDIRVLADLPFVHRFGIIQRDGIKYLLAATVKSAHAFEEDWTCPGRLWAAELPEDLSVFDKEHQLGMKPIMSGLFHNHGFQKIEDNGYTSVLIGSDNGVIKCIPPKSKGGEWGFETLLAEAASDMIMLDFDGDGEAELLTMAPFHGDTLSIYKKSDGQYKKIYENKEKLEFLHAIWSGSLLGIPTAIIGYRRGKKELLAIRCSDKDKLEFTLETVDRDVGPANVLHYTRNGTDYFLAANREINEIALYQIG